MSEVSSAHLLWLDLETTGTKNDDDILAVGVILTKIDLQPIAEAEWYIHHPQSVLDKMPPFVANMHITSGTMIKVFHETAVGLETVANIIMDMLAAHTKRRQVYLAGSSIHFDRRFIRRDLPAVDDWLHYRMLDVSTLRVLIELIMPTYDFGKFESAHTPLADLRRSMLLLKQNMAFLANYSEFWGPDVHSG